MKNSVEQTEDYGLTPCDVIFNHTEKPENYLRCKSMNVFNDRWRVNIYSTRYVEGIEGKCISKSYFVTFNSKSGQLSILS
jgi:hypothetical protein